ncbi:MAG: radical SAM protein [Pseudomonadota bacterium]
MRVLLHNPAIRPEQFGRFAALLEPMPCIGLAYVATFLARAGHQVRVYDEFVLRRGEPGVLEALAAFEPDALGVSILTPVAGWVIELLREARRRWPVLRIFAGNLHADLFPEELQGLCDAVVHGEGEQASVDLLAAWARGERGEGIPGVTVLTGTELVRGPARPLATDLDSFPFPDWSLLPYRRYTLMPLGTMARPLVTAVASRGCPNRCDYCALSYQGQGVRHRSVGHVVDELEHDVARFGVRQVGFMDPVFPLHDEQAIDFSREILRRGLHQRLLWLSELRPDSVGPEALGWMRRAGCRRLVMGIETGVESLAHAMNRRFDRARTRDFVRACRRADITTVGLFMIGMPGETPEQTEETIRYACSLELDFAKFAITVPFPGSKLYDDLKARGVLDGHRWADYTTFNPDAGRIAIASQVQRPEQLLASLRSATKRFYLRPGLALRHLVRIRSVDARQLARGLWSLAPDLGRRLRAAR